jgi:hypothetical protein
VKYFQFIHVQVSKQNTPQDRIKEIKDAIKEIPELIKNKLCIFVTGSYGRLEASKRALQVF